MAQFRQTPSEKLIYEQDISGDTIVTAVWSINPGATLDEQTNTPTSTLIRVSGLSTGTTYSLSVVITGASTQVFQRCVTITCKNC